MQKTPLKKTQHKFFDKPSKDNPLHYEQNVTVSVVINEKQGGIGDCIKALFSCTKKAAK